MICQRCGRELSDEAFICAGCGQQQRRADRPQSGTPGDSLRNKIGNGKRGGRSAGRAVAWLAALALLLTGFGASLAFVDYNQLLGQTGALISSAIQSIDLSRLFGKDGEKEPHTQKVSGTVVIMHDEYVDRRLVEQYQNLESEWYREELIDGKITVKFMRLTRNDDWLNTHIFELYPDITRVDSYDKSPVVSGIQSTRILIPENSEAPNCYIDAVVIDDGQFDYIFIVQTPKDSFVEYEYIIEDWINSIELADSSQLLSLSGSDV